MPGIVEVEGITRAFGDTQALCGIDLEVEEGTVLALLGPNGAGKTTLVRILSTLLPPDGGHARVAGFDVVDAPVAVRRCIGTAGQFAAVDEVLTGRAPFAGADIPASSQWTRKTLGWEPKGPDLIADIDRPIYFDR